MNIKKHTLFFFGIYLLVKTIKVFKSYFWMTSFITEYLEELLREAGHTDPADIELFSKDLEPLLIERLYLTTMAALPEDLQKQAELLVDKSPTDFHDFCHSHIKKYDDLVETVFQDFAEDYLSAFEEDE
jgi:hypothetical protein